MEVYGIERGYAGLIEDSAFDELSSDAEIFVAEGNPYYHVAGNNLIDRRTRSVVAGVTPQTLPADGSVTAIGGSL